MRITTDACEDNYLDSILPFEIFQLQSENVLEVAKRAKRSLADSFNTMVRRKVTAIYSIHQYIAHNTQFTIMMMIMIADITNIVVRTAQKITNINHEGMHI